MNVDLAHERAKASLDVETPYEFVGWRRRTPPLHRTSRTKTPSHRWLGRCVILAVLILFGRNLWSIHSSTTTSNIPPDLHVISHVIPTKNDTTELWNEYLARLPPVPWPVDSDGCYAEMGTRPYCQFRNLLIDLSRVASVNKGGEPLVVVNDSNNNNNNATNQSAIIMGQDEANEYLTYQLDPLLLQLSDPLRGN